VPKVSQPGEAGQWRTYRTSLIRPVAFTYTGGAALIVTLRLLSYASDHGSVVVTALVGVIWIALIYWALWVGVHIGVRETEEGLASQFSFMRPFVAWDDIETFETPKDPPFGWTKVYARCRSGKRVTLAVMQDRQVVWQGGETRDIVSVLTERLAEVQRTRATA
jgi:hypothetical protein